MSNSDQLAEVYNPDYRQIVVIFPIVWKHEVGGNWFISGYLNGEDNV
jgi:hypothetical protein